MPEKTEKPKQRPTSLPIPKVVLEDSIFYDPWDFQYGKRHQEIGNETVPVVIKSINYQTDKSKLPHGLVPGNTSIDWAPIFAANPHLRPPVIFPRTREKRAINAIGGALKTMFGTMDNADRKIIEDQFDRVALTLDGLVRVEKQQASIANMAVARLAVHDEIID